MKFTCKKCGSTEYEIKSKPNGTGTATGLYCAKCGFWHKWLGKDEKRQYEANNGSERDELLQNEKFAVELGEVIEVRDAQNLPTVEVNIKVNLDGIFLSEAMREAISKAFDGNQLLWHEVANIFLGDIAKVYLGLLRGLKK